MTTPRCSRADVIRYDAETAGIALEKRTALAADTFPMLVLADKPRKLIQCRCCGLNGEMQDAVKRWCWLCVARSVEV